MACTAGQLHNSLGLSDGLVDQEQRESNISLFFVVQTIPPCRGSGLWICARMCRFADLFGVKWAFSEREAIAGMFFVN